MGIRKSRTTTFRRVRSGFATSKHVVKKTSAYVDPLQAKEREQESSGRSIDPASFMTRKQKKAWRRLSPAKRRQYIRQAEKEAGRMPAVKGIALKEKHRTGLSGRRTVDPETAGRLAGVSLEVPADERKEKDRKTKFRPEEGTQRSSRQGSEGRTAEGPSGPSRIQGTGTLQEEESSLLPLTSGSPNGKSGNTGTAAESTGKAVFSAEEGAAAAGTGGATAAALAAKKAADRFKKDLSARLAGEQMAKEKQTRDDGSPLSSVGNAGVESAGAMIGAVLHVAAQFVSGIVTTLSVLVLPIAILATLVGFTIALFTGIGGAVEDMEAYYMGGGQDLVDVAVREIGYRENPDGSTKYGTWCGIGNASWCHAFISWCANECGYIKDGTLPKTGACETGRQWFIHRDEYQPKGSYEPLPGDIVYFRHGSETVSHHAGVVEFVENGILHTIEGNSGGIVKRRNYPLNADRIMGYGTPAYPDLGIDAYGSSAEFLQKAEALGKLIVSDGNWIYSNNGTYNNLADARRARQPKTNCAAGVSIAMQEFGTLKKKQTFYSGSGGALCGSSAVKKRIRQYYDIIDTHGASRAKGVRLEPGDICLWEQHVNIYAGVRDGKKTWIDFGRNQTSDHKAESGYYVRYMRKGDYPSTLYHILRLKDQDSYGRGKQIRIPAGLGDTYTYMGWSIIHNWPTRQYYLRERSGEHYDRHGFAVVDGRYVIACTTTFGKVGDHIDFVLDNGKVIHAIMGDEKSQADDGCNRWGHDNGHSVVEFVVNKQMWYGHLGNSDITRFHPEWKSRVKMGVNLGKNFFDK